MPRIHLTQLPDSAIRLTPKPAFGQVDLTMHTEEHGLVTIAFDEESLSRYTPWSPEPRVVCVPASLFATILAITVMTSFGLILSAGM